MKPSELTGRRTEWLSGKGPGSDIVISSRIRLARNVSGFPFLGRCDGDQQQELEIMLSDALKKSAINDELHYFNIDHARGIERNLLVERQLISRQLADGNGPRGVGVSDDETLSVMVNEEDHLRIQVLRSGLQIDECFAHANDIDDELEKRIPYAFSGRWGYLTACPTNVGTGIRISVMLHLPALKMTGEIERVFQAARDMRLAVRGLYGEGTEAAGDFFQISNQTTLGRSEREIIEDFSKQIIPEIIRYEQSARQSLLAAEPAKMDDKIFRALGLLSSARLISSSESLHLLSLVRLGVNLGRIPDLSIEKVNDLFLAVQPSHIQQITGHELDDIQRDKLRADLIRKRIS